MKWTPPFEIYIPFVEDLDKFFYRGSVKFRWIGYFHMKSLHPLWLIPGVNEVKVNKEGVEISNRLAQQANSFVIWKTTPSFSMKEF